MYVWYLKESKMTLYVKVWSDKTYYNKEFCCLFHWQVIWEKSIFFDFFSSPIEKHKAVVYPMKSSSFILYIFGLFWPFWRREMYVVRRLLSWKGLDENATMCFWDILLSHTKLWKSAILCISRPNCTQPRHPEKH